MTDLFDHFAALLIVFLLMGCETVPKPFVAGPQCNEKGCASVPLGCLEERARAAEKGLPAGC